MPRRAASTRRMGTSRPSSVAVQPGYHWSASTAMPPPESGTDSTTCSGPSARSVAAGPAGQVVADAPGTPGPGATVTVERRSAAVMAATRGSTVASEVTAQQVATKAAGNAPG